MSTELSAELSADLGYELGVEPNAGLGDELSLLHSRARNAAAGFRRAEGELMEALIAVDRAKVHFRLGYASLFQYAVSSLGLSEGVAYAAIAVARKAESVPALREAITAGTIGFSKARKVVAVLDPAQPVELQSRWVEKAISLSSRKLERAVAQASPRAAISERAVYKSEKRIELTLGVSETIMLDFRAAQDLVSSIKGDAASLEETLARVLEIFLARKDPERRARRVMAKKGSRAVAKDSTNLEASGSVSSAGSSTSGASGRSSNGSPSDSAGSRFSATGLPSDATGLPSDATGLPSDATGLPSDATGLPSDATHLTLEGSDSTSFFAVSALKPATALAPEDIALGQSSEQNGRTLLFTGTVGDRKPVPAATLHAVRLRDRNSCQAVLPDGRKCGSKRWLEIHHRRPVSAGGTNDLGNLITYCRTHHRFQHHGIQHHKVPSQHKRVRGQDRERSMRRRPSIARTSALSPSVPLLRRASHPTADSHHTS